MATERSTERIIDLLYDELSGEEEISLRREIEESEELRAEFEGLENFKSDLDAVFVQEEVSASLHDSIMEAAREAATSSVEEQARAIRRPPTARAPGGFWGRLAKGKASQISQVALVATVLLAGVFVFQFVDEEPLPAPGKFSAERERSADFKAAAKADPMAQAKTAPAGSSADEVEAKPAEGQRELLQEEMDKRENKLAERELATGVMGADKSGSFEDSLTRAGAGKAGAKKSSRRQTRESKGAKTNAMPRPKTPQKAVKKKSDTLDYLGDRGAVGASAGEKAPSSKNTPQAAPAKKQEAGADDLLAAVPAAAAPAPSVEPTPQSAPQQAEEPWAQDSAKDKEAFRPDAGTIDAVEEYYAKGDYKRTIVESDAVLSSSATNMQKARALELKATSYMKMGQLSQADSVYRNLQTNYPEYKSDSIRKVREDLSRRLTRKRSKKKRKVSPKRSYDFDPSESSMPNSLD